MRNNADKRSSYFYGIIQFLVISLTLLWVLAVVKVFVIGTDPLEKNAIPGVVKHNQLPQEVGKPAEYKGSFMFNPSRGLNVKNLESDNKSKGPYPSEWDMLYAEGKHNINSKRSANGDIDHAIKLPPPIQQLSLPDKIHTVVENEELTVKEEILDASALSWPPIVPATPTTAIGENVFPKNNGYDIMPMTGFKVPKFWSPPPGEDIYKIGSKVNGEPTIFIMIASYRDFQCRETIASAFERAKFASRVFIGAVDQLSHDDIGCTYTPKSCEEDPTQTLCKYKEQISVYTMNASYATGPVTARHIGDRLYRGQYFVMQIDAHCLFVNNWDTKIIEQFKQTNNDKAVLSSYLSDVQGSIDARGNSLRDSRPIMCNSDYEGVYPARYLRHGSQPEDKAIIRNMPQLQPFWAAGFSFGRGHFTVQVPYDGYQPMVFQGEEIAIGIRGFTYGYDFYAPRDSVIFHEYASNSGRRKTIHMFWENSEKHKGEGQKSLKRSLAVIGMAPDVKDSEWDHTEIEKYGLGTERTTDLFYKLFLIQPVERKAVQLCPFVKSGIMHRDFQPFLRPNGLGIDYSKLASYPTKTKLNEQLKIIGKPLVP